MKRRWDMIVASVGGILTLLFIGGIAVTMRVMDVSDFESIYNSLFSENGKDINETFKMLQSLTALFSVALFLSLFFLMLALVFSWRGRYRYVPSILYGIAGLILLIGTQFIAYPLAFFFFLASGISIYQLKTS